MFDKNLHEECGVFAVDQTAEAAALTALGLHALQHRGQEAAGIVSCDGQEFFTHHAQGQVGDIFHEARIIKALKGEKAIGHVRYSTAGSKFANHIQPLLAEFSFGKLALAHNGNLTNALALRHKLISKGAIFSTVALLVSKYCSSK